MGWTVVAPWKLNGNSAQKMTATGTSAQSSAVGDQTRAVLITAITANVHIEIGHNPVASATTSHLVKTTDGPVVYGCSPSDKVAVIQDTSGGVIYISELTH